VLLGRLFDKLGKVTRAVLRAHRRRTSVSSKDLMVQLIQDEKN
jgi:hypothetical protein